MAICTTDTAAIVGSIFHSRYWRMAMGSVVSPGATRKSENLEIAEADHEAQERRRHEAGPDRRQRHLERRHEARGAETQSRVLDGGIEALQVGGDDAQAPGDGEQHVGRGEAHDRAHERQAGQDLGLDEEEIEPGADDDRRHDDGGHEELEDGLAAAEGSPRERECRRHARREPEGGREEGHLEARHEAVDELPLAQEPGVPAQRIARRRQRRDGTLEEAQPDDEDDGEEDEDIGAVGGKAEGKPRKPRRDPPVPHHPLESSRARIISEAYPSPCPPPQWALHKKSPI